MVELDKSDRNQFLNNIWLETILALVGETLGDVTQINGAVVQSRRGKDKVSIWVRNGTKSDELRTLGINYKNTIGTKFRMKFQKHDATASSSMGRKFSIQI